MNQKLTKLRDKCTEKQAKFIELLNSGFERAIAYQNAGFKAKNKRYAIMCASRLMTSCVNTKAYSVALREEQERKQSISRGMQLGRLNTLYDMAIGQKNVTAGASVIREQNEMLGYHRENAPNQEREQARKALIDAEDVALLELVRARTGALAGRKAVKSITGDTVAVETAEEADNG